MTTIDQQNQHVETQYNAETITINNGVTFEQYSADLAKRQKEIQLLMVKASHDDRDRQDLEKQLAEIAKQQLDERKAYESHVEDLNKRIERLDQLSGQIPDKFIEEAKQALLKGDYDKADQLFTQIEDTAEPHIGAAAEAAYQRGELAQYAYKHREAYQHFLRATQLIPDNPWYLQAAGSAAIICDYPAKAIELLEIALAIFLKQNGQSSPEVIRSWIDLGIAWTDVGQPQKSAPYFNQAMEASTEGDSAENPTVATIIFSIGQAYRSINLDELALECFEHSMHITVKCLGEEHSSLANIYRSIGDIRIKLDQAESAIPFLEMASHINIEGYGENYPGVGQDFKSLGDAWESLDELEKALEMYELALGIYLDTIDVNHPSVANVLSGLGAVWQSMGENEKSIECHELSLTKKVNWFGEAHPDVAGQHIILGLAFDEMEQPEKSTGHYKLAFISYLNAYGIDYELTKTSFSLLRWASKEIGQAEKAREFYEATTGVAFKEESSPGLFKGTIIFVIIILTIYVLIFNLD